MSLRGNWLRLYFYAIFFYMIRHPPRSTLFPTRRSSDLLAADANADASHVAGRSVDHGRYDEGRHSPRIRRMTSFIDRKSTRLNSSHSSISYAVFCLKKKITNSHPPPYTCPAKLIQLSTA